MQLGIETATLDGFKAQSSDQVELFMRVFEQWKSEATVPYTWDTVINTLEKINEGSTAAEIKEWRNTEQTEL